MCRAVREDGTESKRSEFQPPDSQQTHRTHLGGGTCDAPEDPRARPHTHADGVHVSAAGGGDVQGQTSDGAPREFGCASRSSSGAIKRTDGGVVGGWGGDDNDAVAAALRETRGGGSV